MQKRTILFILIGLMLCTPALLAGDAARLYVVNSLSENVTVIDTANDKVISTIPLQARGYNLDVSPDHKLLYVTCTTGDARQANTAPSSKLVLLDLSEQQPPRSLLAPLSPLATVHALPDGKQVLLVTAAPPGERNTARGSVHYLDLATGAITRSIPIGLNPLVSAITPDGRKLYTADWASRAISIIDVASGRLLDSLPLGQYATRQLAMRPDGTKLYTALEPLPVIMNATANSLNANYNNYRAQTQSANMALQETDMLLWEIDTTSDAIIRYPIRNLNPIYALALSPDGAHAYLYGRTPAPIDQHIRQQQAVTTSYQLIAVDLKTKRIARQLGDYGYISNMVVSPDNKRIYLIGTPGDPAREQQAQQNFTRAIQSEQQTKGNVFFNDSAVKNNLIQDIAQINKTVTIIDTKTGKILNRLTIGSLPQGAKIVK